MAADFQNRAGSKFGGGGIASEGQAGIDRRERLRKLALETIDIQKDPYILRNHLGGIECRLCLTLHTGEDVRLLIARLTGSASRSAQSYLAHTQGKKHQTNLARRAAREAKDAGLNQSQALAAQEAARLAVAHKQFVKIGSPGYSATRIRDPITNQLGLLLQIHYPHVKDGVKPLHRFMSSYEQHVEQPNKDIQYLVVACEPYSSIAFAVPSRPVDETEGVAFSHWDVDTKAYSVQFLFK